MNNAIRVINKSTLKYICQTCKGYFDTIILGHEACPHFYNLSNIDEMITMALEAGFKVKVNIPTLFEQYLDEFKKECDRLINTYPDVKLILNDWGIIYYLHNKWPNIKFAVGKGVSFSYGDCPWNQDIIREEKEEYQSIFMGHNMESDYVMGILKQTNIDEIELSDTKMCASAYKRYQENGFSVSVNEKMCVVSVTRACHTLRYLDKLDILGNQCMEHCVKPTKIKTSQYFDMILQENKPVSKETSKIQPETIYHGNLLLLENQDCNTQFNYVDTLIIDERIYIGDDERLYKTIEEKINNVKNHERG